MIVEEILLDTNVLLRFLFEPERLPADVIKRIADGRNRVWFSILSLWEIAIKQALRRDAFDFARENVKGPPPRRGLRRWGGRDRLIMRASSTASHCETSCRFAPVTTSDNGTPRPSTSKWRLLPFFPPIRWIGANA